MPIRHGKRPGGGAAPFGYRWQSDILVPQPEEASVRKHAYELFLEHRNQRTVARLLNEMGYRTRRGASFSSTTVGRMLRDPLAKGQRPTNATVSLGMKKHRKLTPSSERYFSKVQPIVSEDLWNQANTILWAKRKATQVAGRSRSLDGVTFCACGQQMSIISKSPVYFCRKCRNKIDIADLDTAVQEYLRKLVSRTGIPQTLSSMEVIIKAREDDLRALQQETAGMSEKMDQVYQAYTDYKISEQDFRQAYRPLEVRLRQLEEETLRVLGHLDSLGNQCRPRDEFLAEARNLSEGWHTLGQDDKRSSIQRLVKRITVDRDRVRINSC